MPDLVEVIDFVLGEACDVEAGDERDQALSVERIEITPFPIATPDCIHRRLIHAAPVIGELDPVRLNAFFRAERFELGDHA